LFINGIAIFTWNLWFCKISIQKSVYILVQIWWEYS